MSHYTKGEFDFVKRTLKIIKQYDSMFTKGIDEKYEITLLINCFIGLVIIPHERWINDIDASRVNSDDLMIPKNYISFISDTYNFKNVTTHLRNSAAHGKIQPRSKDFGKKKKITHLNIKDFKAKKYGGEKTFEAEIPIRRIETLAKDIGKAMIKIMK